MSKNCIPFRGWILLLALLSQAAIAADGPTARLVIDYSDGVQMHFTSLAWREGMTALDLLATAKAHRRGVDYSQRGSGSSAMITKIADTANEGGRASGKNWIFYVNDKQSEMGAGSMKLRAGDTVLWKFQAYEYNP